MATSIVGTLVVQLTANSSRFQRELRRSRQRSRSWAQGLRREINSVGRVIGGIGAGFAAATAAIVVSQNRAIDALGKTADKLGETTERLAGFRLAAELTGNSTRTAELGLQRFTRRLAETAATGGGPAAQALERLGLNAAELSTLLPLDALREVADRFETVENNSERVRLAFALFDSEGVGLVNTLRGGAEALDEYQARAEALGITLSRTDVAAVERANDAMTLFGTAIRGAGQRLAVELAPFIDDVATRLVLLIQEAGGFGTVVQNAVQSALNAFGAFGDVLTQIAQGWRQLGEIALRVASSIVGGLARVAEFFGSDFAESLRISEAALDLWADDVGERIRDIAADMTFSDALGEYVAGVRQSTKEWNATADVIENRVRPAVASVKEAVVELTDDQKEQARILGEQWAQRYGGLSAVLIEEHAKGETLLNQFWASEEERIASATALVQGFGDVLVDGFARGEKSAQDWFRFTINLLNTISRNADNLANVFGGIFGGGRVEADRGGAGAGGGLLSGLLGGIGNLFGGGGFLGLFHEGTSRVPRTGAAILQEGEAVIDRRTAAGLRALGGAGGGGGVSVTITNVGGGPAIQEVSRRQLSPEEFELVVTTAGDRVREEFTGSLSSGYGPYNRAIQSNLQAPRRHS